MKQNNDKVAKSGPSLGEMALLIKKQPFFAGLAKCQYEVLAELAILREFEAGETIFHEGDPANRFYLILSGKVQLRVESPDHIGLPTEVLQPGDDLGWSWMFPPFYFSATAQAIEHTRTIFLYGTRLRKRCEEDHDLGYEIMKRISQVAIKRLNTIKTSLSAKVVPIPVPIAPQGTTRRK